MVPVIGLGLVGMSYREAPSAVRAALAVFDAESNGPSRELLAAGEITGVVRIDRSSNVVGGDPAAPPTDVLARGRRSLASVPP